MLILAIDPGPTQSAWLVLDTDARSEGSYGRVFPLGRFATEPNEALLDALRSWAFGSVGRVVIERVAGMGMAVGAEVFETAYWSGRFAEAARPVEVDRITRSQVKAKICGQQHAKDPNVRQALIDRYSNGLGKSVAVGLKATPGPLYGVANDEWAALAVAVAYAERLGSAA